MWGGAEGQEPTRCPRWMGRPLRPPKEAPGGRRGVGGRGVRQGGEKTDRRQDQSYIQVRPTFHQSKTIHSIFMQKFEVECTFQKPSLALGPEAHRPSSWKSSEPGGPRAGRGRGNGRRWGGGLPQRCPVSLFCSLTPVVEHRHFASLKKSWKTLNLQNSTHVRLKKFLFIFFAET